MREFLEKVLAESGLAQPRIFGDWLESGKGAFRTLEITFKDDPTDPAKYESSIEKDYRNFVENLKRACFSDNTMEIAIHVDPANSGQFLTELEQTFCDYKFSSISFKSGKLGVADCRPFYRSESLSLLHQARRGRVAIVNNHAWGFLFWFLSTEHLLSSSPTAGIHIIHIDYHSDLASPRLYFCKRRKRFIDYFTREPVDLRDRDAIAKAIRSTAIGPGNFILPFLYLNRERKCKVDLIVPSIPSHDGDKFSGTDWSVETDGPALPGIIEKTLRLAPCIAGQHGNVEITCKPISDVQLELDFDRYIIILDMDFDFFSNCLKGSSDWLASPGWHPDFKTRSVLLGQAETLLSQLLQQGITHATTVSTSPDFCPAHVRVEAFQRLSAYLDKMTENTQRDSKGD